MAWPLVAMAVASAASKFIGDRKKAKAAQSDREQQNANEAARAKAIQDMLAQLKARGIDPYGKQTNTSQQTTTTSGSQVSKKLIDPIARSLASKIVAQQEAELNRGDLYGAGQVAQQARQANQAAEAALAASRNAGAARGLSQEALMAMAMPANLARTRAVLDFQASLPQLNADWRQKIRGEGWGTVRDTMGERVDTNQTQNVFGSQTTGPDLQALLALAQGAVPQNVSTQTGYSPWASGLAAGADAVGSLYGAGAFGGGGAGQAIQALPAARNMTWAGLSGGR